MKAPFEGKLEMDRNQIMVGKHQLFIVASLLILLGWPSLLSNVFDYNYDEILPSIIELIPCVLALVVVMLIVNPYGKLIGFVWLAWYFVGVLNTLASSVVLGSYFSQLELGPSTVIYFFGCIFYFSGVLIFEKNNFVTNENSYSTSNVYLDIGKRFGFLLLMFPFIWLVSLYSVLGYFPILSNVDLVGDMYEISYGPLYPYGAVMVISILYSGFLSITSTTRRTKFSYLALTVIIVLISTVDGKRAFAMTSVGGLIALSFKLMKEKTWTRVLPVIAIFLLVLYIGVNLIRIERNGGQIFDSYSQMMLVGVEFRDFVYTVNFFKPGEIYNYHYAASSFASLTNGWVMSLFGLDKNEIVNLDSAHAWAEIYGSSLGIRTGIISELWFAYGLIGMLVLLLFGFISGFVIEKIRAAKSVRVLLFVTAIFGLLLIGITNQSTVTFGFLPTFFYLYVTMWLFEKYFS